MVRILNVFAILIFLSACQKKDSQVPVETPSPFGIIKGKVKHYSYEGNEINLALNTTTVSLLNSSITAITDSTGAYVFSNLPSGAYSLKYDKPGTGLCKKEEVWLEPGVTLVIDTDLADTATWLITDAGIIDTLINSENHMLITIGCGQTESQLFAQIFFSKNNAINSREKSSYELQMGLIIPFTKTHLSKTIPYSALKDRGYQSGDKFFAKIYPVNPNAGYSDKSGIWIGTGAGLPYPTFTLTMP